MEHYITFKMVHMLAAYLTAVLFIVRLGLDAAGKPGWRTTPLRWIPHANDTLLLTMAIVLVVLGGWNIFAQHWLLLKIVLLVGYIVAGLFALKPKFPKRTRVIAAVLALVQLLVIFHLAMAKPF
ncbi:SirB2 family protein [Aliidiomarina sanyensis]|uniref:Invasion protein n=1 Tax=Aliidiomarina sanyensis TaxID=1249555 RepID=A0A432WPQ7_9GAMM|nr:SirB2 family protein [Aliidiomarina sanyensis]RUO35786.1 invasion protein [Aliidiomarina sanyensis]